MLGDVTSLTASDKNKHAVNYTKRVLHNYSLAIPQPQHEQIGAMEVVSVPQSADALGIIVQAIKIRLT